MGVKHLRCDDATWEAALKRAADDGLPLAEILRQFLASYAANEPPSRTYVVAAWLDRDGLPGS